MSAENWNPNTAGPDCDWCGECDWCSNLGRSDCDCDYWHSEHRWHCATNYGGAA